MGVRAQITVTLKRVVYIEVDADFDPYDAFTPQTLVALNKAGALTEADNETITQIDAEWDRDY